MPNGRHLAVITIPVAAYGCLHALGWKYPAELWGVDQLHYYGVAVQVICGWLMVVLVGLALSPERAVSLDRAIGSRLAWITSARPPRWLLPTGICVLTPCLLYALRVREHTLGDSSSWYNSVEAYVASGQPPPFTWAVESLDFGVHVAVYWLGTQLTDWSASDAYQLLSIASGVAYVFVTQRLAATATSSPSKRAALTLVMLTLGSVQLFFGYGESYTLVAVMTAVYFWQGIQFLDRGTGWRSPAASLAVACAFHLMALCLAPSLLYLLRHDKGWLGQTLRRNSVFVAILVVGGLAGVAFYFSFYHHHALPLLEPAAPGRYPLVSLAHLATLANEVLLISPFGLVWGAMLWKGCRAPDSQITFVGLAALGSGALVTVHYTAMGGRDWDLMSFAGLPCVLWGTLTLFRTIAPSEILPHLRVVVVPLMALHTGLWIGINASPEKAQRRLGSLVLYTNQSEDYRYFTQGYYDAVIMQRDYSRAAERFQMAVNTADPSELSGEGSRAYTYRKFLASSLARAHRYQEALSLIRQIYSTQTRRFISPNDVALHEDWVMACERQAELATLARDTTAANEYWREALGVMQVLSAHSPGWARHRVTARILSRLGKRREAISLYAEALESSPEFGKVLVVVGDAYHQQGYHEDAVLAYAQVVAASPGEATHAETAKALSMLSTLGHLPRGVLGPGGAQSDGRPDLQSALNRVWSLQVLGDFDRAIQVLRTLAVGDTTGRAMFVLGLTYLRSGLADSARATYSQAVARFGADRGRSAEADAHLRWLVTRGEQAAEAGSILRRYWP